MRRQDAPREGHLNTMQLGDGPLCVRGGRGDEAPVLAKYLQPGCDVAGVVFSRFQRKLQIRTKEDGIHLRKQFFSRILCATCHCYTT